MLPYKNDVNGNKKELTTSTVVAGRLNLRPVVSDKQEYSTDLIR